MAARHLTGSGDHPARGGFEALERGEDHPLLTRVEGFSIEGCEGEAFASHRLTTGEGRRAVEGHFRPMSHHPCSGDIDSGAGPALIRRAELVTR